jgi:prepilin-type N-terminal cleavage/methylation domain-containing protein
MKLKGFTLSEVLITLTVIGVVMAITIPVLNHTKPNKDRVIYRKAIMVVQEAIANVMNSDDFDSSTTPWMGDNVGESDFCDKISEELNVSGNVDCTSASSYDSPNFITTDGNRYWGFEGKFTTTSRIVYTDRMLTSKELSRLSKLRDSNHSTPGLKILVYNTGRTRIPNTDEYNYERNLAENANKIN